MLILRAILVAVGLVVAAFAFLLAMAMGGGGHGWVQPLLYSIGLFLAYPLVLVRRTAPGRKWIVVDFAIIALGVLLDILLIAGTAGTEAEYFEQVFRLDPVYPLVWILLWAGWQLIALNCLLNDGQEPAGA